MLLCTRASLPVLLTLAISLVFGLAGKPKEIPLTQIPLLGNYVMNKEVAPYLGDAAEFAIRLLQWSDTNRPSVLKVQKTIKGETYAQEWGANLDYHPLPLEGVIKLTGDTYWALESPRLIKAEISDQIVLLQAPEQLDLLHAQAVPVPFVVRNSQDQEIRVAVQSSGSALSIESEPRHLKPGQTLGWFVLAFAEDLGGRADRPQDRGGLAFQGDFSEDSPLEVQHPQGQDPGRARTSDPGTRLSDGSRRQVVYAGRRPAPDHQRGLSSALRRRILLLRRWLVPGARPRRSDRFRGRKGSRIPTDCKAD